MRPLELNQELVRLLQRIRREHLASKVYGYRHDFAWPIAWKAVKPLLDSIPVSSTALTHYVSFLKELVKLFRYRDGGQLAQGIEVLVRKWRDLTLDLELLQKFVPIIWNTYEALLKRTLPKSALQPKKERKRPKRSYEQAIEDGAVPVEGETTKQQQAQKYRDAIAHNRDVSRRVSLITRGLDVPGRDFVKYSAFAFRVDRVARKYGDRTLAMEVANLVDESEAMGLRRDVLLAICRDGFRVEPDYGPYAG